MKIWFNHWFSTAYHLINLMKNGDSELKFIGSCRNMPAVFTKACDEVYSEPDNISGEEYIKFCLDFCREHKIDIFVPRRELVNIVKHSEDFKKIGVKLFACNNPELIRILDDKILTYNKINNIVPEIIPEIYLADSFEKFVYFYNILKEKYKRICYKLTIDEGACSFRIIDNSIEDLSGLMNKAGYKLTFDTAKKILSKYDFKIPMIIMPYLSGMEISVDCLSTAGGNIIIPRYKNGRYSEIIFDDTIINICDNIIRQLDIKMPLNIQFKCEDEKPYLLEINPRMSGGLQLSCMASGINIPNIALNQLNGNEIKWELPKFKSQKIANIETPICL